MTDYTSPHWDRAALLVIDVQQDFLDHGAAPIGGTSDILPALRVVLEGFRAAGLPIAHVIRLYEPGSTDADLVRRGDLEASPGLVAPGSTGSQLAPQLFDGRIALDPPLLLTGQRQVITDSEVVLYKPRWSAFYRTDLHAWLTEAGVDTVVVAGCNLPNCPRATLFDATSRDLRTVLAVDAVSQVTPERLADLSAIGVTLATNRQITGALSTLG